MARIKMVIYEDENSELVRESDKSEAIVWSDEPLYSSDEEAAAQAYRLLERYYKKVEETE